jgi:hypothetical protein
VSALKQAFAHASWCLVRTIGRLLNCLREMEDAKAHEEMVGRVPLSHRSIRSVGADKESDGSAERG